MNTKTDVTVNHDEMVRALVKPGQTVLNSLSPEKVNFWHAATGVNTEAAELLDAAKKVCIYGKPVDIINIVEELGDIEFYMAQVRHEFGLTREQVLQSNIDKLSIRYADRKYSDAQAIARKDKVE